MGEIKIIKVSPEEIDKLQKISIQTFTETFSSKNSKEDMNAYLGREFSSKKLKIELADRNAEFYFALFETQVIGYLKINYGTSQTEIKDSNALEIERIYVLQEYHGKKVGQLLYEKVIEISKQKNVDYIWLGVWEENPRAISFYKKNGFVEFDKHIFKLGSDEQTDIMMKLEIGGIR